MADHRPGEHEHRHHGHGHGHAHGHTHDSSPSHSHDGHRPDPFHALGRLIPHLAGRRRVHQLDRRQFLADMGRGTFAVAILGTGVAACSSSEPSSGDAAPASDAPATTDGSAPASDAPATTDGSAPASDAPATTDGSAPTSEELRWSQVSMGFVSAYVLVRGNEAAVVDTGNPGGEAAIADALSTMGVGWSEVAHVILTHHHGDHIGGLSGVLTNAPTAMTYAGEADIANIISPNPLTAVGDGDEVFGLEVIHTPGHTPGSISVLDQGIGLLVAGDALNGNDDGTEISGPNPDFSSDLATAEESVKKLAGFSFDAAAFGHGNPVETGAGPLVADLAASL